ncbi:phosphoglycerate kinase [Candidatus Parcubacteria bacterium]|nr:phosphoglycerate kinase [Candidatus Parcubacteria bacterium]
MKSIKEAGDLKGKKVLVRVDWNVPIQDGVVLDDFRIKKSQETLEYLTQAGGEVLIATHLEEGDFEVLKNFVPLGAVLLPNLRGGSGEEENSEEFAKSLAAQAEVYVNEAFSVSHRKHASIVSVPKLLPSFAGINFVAEVENLSKAFNPTHPFLFILGGAKFETKAPLIHKFLDIADEIFIGGLNAAKAYETELKDNPKIFFPHGDIKALDVDEETIKNLQFKINNSEFILWNGPVGKYEDEYKKGTLEIAQAIANSGKESIVGGGDTIAAIKELNLFDKFSFVSTAGGAMLDFLATGTLPGIEALG